MNALVESLRPFVPARLWGLGYHAAIVRERLRGGLDALSTNAASHNAYAGRRGFVIGNGASLKKMNLRSLCDEVVVTVNSFFDHQELLGVRSTAHVFFDDYYFGAGQQALRRYAAGKRDTMTFLPLQGRSVASAILPDAQYFFPAGAFEHNTNLDLSRPVPFFQTVALPALLVALHLGLNPIYFIGCDLDFLSHVVDVSPLRVRVPYFYDEGEPQIVEPSFDYLGYVRAVERMIAGFRFLYDHMPPTRRILNAGAGGVIDVFDRVELDELFR